MVSGAIELGEIELGCCAFLRSHVDFQNRWDLNTGIAEHEHKAIEI